MISMLHTESAVPEAESKAELRRKLRKVFKARRAQGWIPYEGRWFRPEEFASLVEKKRRIARFHTFEVSLLLVMMLAMSAFVLLLLLTLAY